MDDELKQEIITAYQLGKVSIQDIARIKRVTVQTVLDAIGHSDVGRVSVGGDLIDPTEAGPEANMNYGREFNVPFSLD